MINEAEMYRKMFGTLSKAIFKVTEICTDQKCVEMLEEALLDSDDVFIAYHEKDNVYP